MNAVLDRSKCYNRVFSLRFFFMPRQNLGNFSLLVGIACLALAPNSDRTVNLTKDGLLPSLVFSRAMVAWPRKQRTILEEFLLEDMTNYQKIIDGSLTVALSSRPVSLWLLTSHFSDYTCVLICTHACTFACGIGKSPQKYETRRNTGLNC